MTKPETMISMLLLCCLGTAHAQTTARSTSAGVFTAEQARRGEAAYQANCAACHGAELRSTDPEVPGLTDGQFTFNWQKKTIAEKFTIVRDTMPPNAGRSLPDETYLDIVTYILRFNKVPAGKEALPLDLDVLKQIVISAPPS